MIKRVCLKRCQCVKFVRKRFPKVKQDFESYKDLQSLQSSYFLLQHFRIADSCSLCRVLKLWCMFSEAYPDSPPILGAALHWLTPFHADIQVI